MKDSKHKSRFSLIRKLLVISMVIMLALVIEPIVADAATQPKLSKTSLTILEGKKYDLNIANKVKKSTYIWATSNKKIATVDKKGVVKGINKGEVKITCTVKTPKKSYKLTAAVTVKKPALSFKINNKIVAMNAGQTYDLNRTMSPSTSNDITKWTSSDSTVAAPDKMGKFKALKAGTVTITGTTLSGRKDSVTITVFDKNGTVKTQADLNKILGSIADIITVDSTDATTFDIVPGDYSKQKLIVNAPKADVTNAGKFASIDILGIKPSTWYEKAVGNLIKVLASESRIVISPKASASIEVTKEGAILTIVNDGTVQKLTISAKDAALNLSGDSKDLVPVEITVPNVKISSSVPLNIKASEKAELTLLPGAEATKITVTSEAAIPTIKGNVTILVIVGEGASAKTVEVKGTPISNPAGGGIGGGAGGGTGGGDNGNTNFTFDTAITDISSITINYKNGSYTMDGTVLQMIQGFVTNENLGLLFWTTMPDGYTATYSGKTVLFNNTSSATTKTVTVNGTKSYTVTMNSAYSITITSASGLSATITEGTDNKSFTVATSQPITLDTVLDSNVLTYYCNVESVSVTYANKTYVADSDTLIMALVFALDPEDTYDYWMSFTDKSKTINGKTLHITGSGATKTVTYDGQSFEVTVIGTGKVYVTNAAGVTLAATRGTSNFSVTLN